SRPHRLQRRRSGSLRSSSRGYPTPFVHPFSLVQCEEFLIVRSNGMPWRRRGAAAAILAASLALVASGCSSSGSGSSANGSTGGGADAAGDKSSTVKIQITSQGCEPKPASVPAGAVEFDITNSGAAAVTEA